MRTRYQPRPDGYLRTDGTGLADLGDMDIIKEMARLPFLLKGVQTAEDAEISVQHGVDVIWVSNHGGRQIDHGLGSMDTLPEIVQAVQGKARIIVDGGVQRGTDILKVVAFRCRRSRPKENAGGGASLPVAWQALCVCWRSWRTNSSVPWV